MLQLWGRPPDDSTCDSSGPGQDKRGFGGLGFGVLGFKDLRFVVYGLKLVPCPTYAYAALKGLGF